MFDHSKLESLRYVSVTRIGGTYSHGFPQTDWNLVTFEGDIYKIIRVIHERHKFHFQGAVVDFLSDQSAATHLDLSELMSK